MTDLDYYNENIFSDKDDERNEESLEEDLNLDSTLQLLRSLSSCQSQFTQGLN